MTAIRHALALALALAAGSASAAAQGFPNKPITIVVPAGAGGPTDTVARLVGESMSRTLGQQIIVENVGARAAPSASVASPSRRPTATRWSCGTSARPPHRRCTTT